MEYQSNPALPLLRRLAAALMLVAFVVTSVGSAIAASPGLVRGQQAAAELAAPHTSMPRPCHRAVLPGTVNTCPLASLSLNSIPADAPGYATPNPAVRWLAWRIVDYHLAAQCGGSSPYRPPCLIA